jgi:hypothetical protein
MEYNSDSGEKVSTVEQLVTEQEFSDLYVSWYNHLFRDRNTISGIMDKYGIDEVCYNTFRVFIDDNGGCETDDNKLVLLGMLYNDYITHTCYRYLEEEQLYNVIALACADLHNQGLYGLVNLLMAESSDENIPNTKAKYIRNYKVDEGLLYEVRNLYPIRNDGEGVIDRWVDNYIKDCILGKTWLRCTPKELNDVYYDKTGVWSVDIDIRQQIFTLVRNRGA